MSCDHNNIYLLVHQCEEYEGGEFEIIAVSHDREKVERERESILRSNKEWEDKVKENDRRRHEFWEENQHKVRVFFRKHKDCLIGDRKKAIRELGLKWHLFITQVYSSVAKENSKKIREYVDLKKLKVPLIEMEYYKESLPTVARYYYEADKTISIIEKPIL